MDEYGWRGASLILAGLLLNCVVCGALFRPIEPRSKSRKRRETDLSLKAPEIEIRENGTTVVVSNGSLSSVPNPRLLQYKQNPMMSNSAHALPVVSELSIAEDQMKAASSELCLKPSVSGNANHSHPHAHHPHVMARKDILYSGSLKNIPLYRSNPAMYTQSVTSLHKTAASETEDTEQEMCCKCLPKSCQCSAETKQEFKSMMDITLLKDPLFLMFAVSNFFTSIGFNSPYIYLPDKATQLGISYDKASFLISMIGIFNTIGRVVFGFLSDRKFVNRLMLYNTALTLCGIFTALSALCVTYQWLMVYSASYGLLIGKSRTLSMI